MAVVRRDFVHIGPRASLYTPSDPTPGQLVTICTWLGASPKHISKYTTLYHRIAPGARILLIESNVPILVSSYARQRRHIQCAVSTVLDTLSEVGFYSPTSDKTATNGDRAGAAAAHGLGVSAPKIILHSFSNGGTNTATQLLIELRTRLSGPLPLAGIVLDSCPAKGTYWKSYNAMVLSLPKDAATQLVGALTVHFLLVLLYAWIGCGNENPASLMRRTLLDGKTLRYAGDAETTGSSESKDNGAEMDGSPPAGRVCYLYSKSDKMVEWTDIRDHAEDARLKGWRVTEVLFEGSEHCAHMSRYEDQYVRAVEAMWRGPDSGTDGKGLSARL